MILFHPERLLEGDAPGPWSAPLALAYDRRDLLLYAVGIGCEDLRHLYEGHAQFTAFPSFAIRWGSLGLQLDEQALPPSTGPLTIDAERCLQQLAPLPLPPAHGQARVQVRSRLLAVHPRGKNGGGAFVEFETEVADDQGRICQRLVTGLFKRGVQVLGDIAPFEGRGLSRSEKLPVPKAERAPELVITRRIPANQAQIYRLSGDDNPLHIDPEAARSGGFDAPILHGLCTYGHCAQWLVAALCDGNAGRLQRLRLRFASPVLPGDELTLRGWQDGPGRLLFELAVGERVVVSNALFEYAPQAVPGAA